MESNVFYFFLKKKNRLQKRGKIKKPFELLIRQLVAKLN